MKTIKAYFFITLLTFALADCGLVRNDRAKGNRTSAEQKLEFALAGKSEDNVLDRETLIIRDSVTAISVVEPILYSYFGKEHIKKQRPYEIFLIDKYWVISGTLPKDYLGGTFLIIIDGRDSRIVEISHGK